MKRYRHRKVPPTTFDMRTGFLVRTGDERPSAPELIDLKVTERCYANCPWCYMSSHSDGSECSANWVMTQLESLEEYPFEVALGGGEPTLWSDIEGFIDWCGSVGIVANASVGPECDLDVLWSITSFRHSLGAVGVSLVDPRKFPVVLNAIGKKTRASAHIVLRRDNIEDTISWWHSHKSNPNPRELDGITFLLFKPHGCGATFRSDAKDMVPTRDQMDLIWETFHDVPGFGFDSCCLSAWENNIPSELVDRCDGGMYSLYVDAVGRKCGRCSFLAPDFNLEEVTLGEAWNRIGVVDGCRYSWSG